MKANSILAPRAGESLPEAATILVVDDYRSICEMISAALRPRGYRVLTASNGREAQALAQKHAKIDLLLTDIEMPEMRGDELAGWFRAAHGGTQILFMSSQRTAREALGPAHFLQKPFRAEALLSKVHEILDQPSAISAKTTP